MINCRNCINWVDETLEQIEADHGRHEHLFSGCRLYGYVEGNQALPACAHYVESNNLYTLCGTCRRSVPKVCVSFGECVNCTDTDLFCVDQCIGGDRRKYCTHFVRLHTEGVHLIDNDTAFDLFPILGMPGQEKKDGSDTREAPPEPGSPAGSKP